MRSRREDVDPYGAVERALLVGLCGMGEVTDERSARRLGRFAAVGNGAFVWTRDGDGLTYLGRLTGALRHDDEPASAAVDLVHVRACTWLPDPVSDVQLPRAVASTFARGGLNFQQIHDPQVERETFTLWESSGP